MIGSLSSALNSSKMEQNLKLKSIESQPILACSYYKDSLLKTMLHCAYALFSTTEAFNDKCAKLRSIFSCLDYLSSLIDSVISNFDSQNPSVSIAERKSDESNIVRISLPFKDQVLANGVRRKLCDLSNKNGPTLQPVFVSKKLEQDLKPKEAKPSIVN